MRTAHLTFPRWFRAASAAAVLLTAAPVTAAAQGRDGERAATVGVDTVRMETATQTVSVIGRIVANQSGVVSALVKGAVSKLLVRSGDRVKAGDVIVAINDETLKWQVELRHAEVMGAEARVQSAIAQAQKRQQELQRLETLKSSAAFSQARFEDARQEVAIANSTAAEARTQLARAKANHELARIDLANARIKAPFAGVVTAVHTEVGTYLGVGQPVMTILNDTELEIEADVQASRTADLEPGMVVGFSLANGASGEAAVRAVIPDENPLTRTRAVRFVPEAGIIKGGFAANQSVSVRIPIGKANEALTVHKDAVLNKAGRQVVFRVVDGKAEIRPVSLGEGIGQRFQVLGGLDAGDVVVVRGNERLRPGQAVNAMKPGP